MSAKTQPECRRSSELAKPGKLEQFPLVSFHTCGEVARRNI
jgi:hypothetical protein